MADQTSDPQPDPPPCNGIRLVVPLAPTHLVTEARDADLKAVVDAHDRSRTRSVERWREYVAGPTEVALGLPDVDAIDAALKLALGAASRDVTLHVATEPNEVTLSKASARQLPQPDDETFDHDEEALRRAIDDGGVSLLHAERYLYPTHLAGLADDLMRALSAPVTTTAVWGEVRASTVRCGNLAVVFAIGADVVVRSVDGKQGLMLPAGTSAPFERFGDLSVGPGGIALVMAADRATRRDLRVIAAHKATGSPALRGDVPVDLRAPARHYGNEAETIVIEHFNAALHDVYGNEADREAAAWWRAGLRSARPRVDAVTWSRVHGGGVALCGTLVGGVGTVHYEEERLLAFGGGLARVDDHLLPLLELVAEAVPFELDRVAASCPLGDARCVRDAVRSLIELGAAYVV